MVERRDWAAAIRYTRELGLARDIEKDAEEDKDPAALTPAEREKAAAAAAAAAAAEAFGMSSAGLGAEGVQAEARARAKVRRGVRLAVVEGPPAALRDQWHAAVQTK